MAKYALSLYTVQKTVWSHYDGDVYTNLYPI